MAYVVCEPCHNCKYTDCVTECPVNAFREGEAFLFICPETCIDCDACVPVCPVNAIFKDEDVPEKWQDYIALNKEMAPLCPEISEKKEPLA